MNDRSSESKAIWERLDRASLEADRRLFAETTPGQRVEQQIQLSRQLTRLAARRRGRGGEP